MKRCNLFFRNIFIVRYKILPGAVTQETEGVTPELWDQILQEYQTINETVDNLAAEQQAFLGKIEKKVLEAWKRGERTAEEISELTGIKLKTAHKYIPRGEAG